MWLVAERQGARNTYLTICVSGNCLRSKFTVQQICSNQILPPLITLLKQLCDFGGETPCLISLIGTKGILNPNYSRLIQQRLAFYIMFMQQICSQFQHQIRSASADLLYLSAKVDKKVHFHKSQERFNYKITLLKSLQNSPDMRNRKELRRWELSPYSRQKTTGCA